MESRSRLTRYAWLSVFTAIAIIVLKVAAYRLTGSIGFLSDALESGANIVAAIFTLIALIVAARPPDREHAYGHSKVEYISTGIEGGLILIAALVIAGDERDLSGDIVRCHIDDVGAHRAADDGVLPLVTRITPDRVVDIAVEEGGGQAVLLPLVQFRHVEAVLGGCVHR